MAGVDDMDVSARAVRFSDAFDAIKRKGTLTNECCVKLDAARLAAVDTTMDLACLRGLRTVPPAEDFLPEAIYVRQEMHDMFDTLLSQHNEGEKRRVLVGSPGIGKSVLFFVVALCRVVAHGQKVLYLRKSDPEFSLFLMEKAANDDEVNILFNRSLEPFANGEPLPLCQELVGKEEMKEYYRMVDGPKHDAPKDDLLRGGFHALCTSAGFPAQKQEQIRELTIHVLSGWTEESIKAALKVIRGCDDLEAEDIYKLSGGRIRLAFLRRDEVEEWYDDVIQAAGSEQIKLAITSKGASGEATSSDRLRTRFYNAGDRKNLMIADSEYVFQELAAQLESSDLIQSYNLARALRLQAARGWFHEEIIHRWFQQNLKPGARGWLNAETTDRNTQNSEFAFFKGDGSGNEGVGKLWEKVENSVGTIIYWVPSKPNPANIDAALLIGKTLICFQYTVQNTHKFDGEKLYEDIVGGLLEATQIEEVQVVFVTPQDAGFKCDHSNFKRSVRNAQQRATRSAQLSELPFTFRSANVEADSEVSLDNGITSNILPMLPAAHLAASAQPDQDQNMAGGY